MVTRGGRFQLAAVNCPRRILIVADLAFGVIRMHTWDAAVPLPPGALVFTLWLSMLCMRSKAWLAAPVLLAHTIVTTAELN